MVFLPGWLFDRRYYRWFILAFGILAALHERSRSGLGQLVDVAMLDGQVAILENAISRFEVTGVVPKPIGNRHPSIVPFEPLTL